MSGCGTRPTAAWPATAARGGRRQRRRRWPEPERQAPAAAAWPLVAAAAASGCDDPPGRLLDEVGADVLGLRLGSAAAVPPARRRHDFGSGSSRFRRRPRASGRDCGDGFRRGCGHRLAISGSGSAASIAGRLPTELGSGCRDLGRDRLGARRRQEGLRLDGDGLRRGRVGSARRRTLDGSGSTTSASASAATGSGSRTGRGSGASTTSGSAAATSRRGSRPATTAALGLSLD